MSTVSLPQSHQLISVFANNVDWLVVPADTAQRIIEDPKGSGHEFTRFIQNGGRVWVYATNGIAVPPGGKVQILSVPVDESRPWDEAVRAAGPNTPADHDVWKVGEQYPATPGSAEVLAQVILVNFGKSMPSEDVLEWGKKQQLHPVSPRICFATSEYLPNLHTYLGMNSMAVVSLASCSFEGERHVPDVWWYRSVRRARLGWFGYAWDGSWFAFVRE